MLLKNWKLLAVLGVFVWSLVTLFQIVPDHPTAAKDKAPAGSLQYYEYLAELDPEHLQAFLDAKLRNEPGYAQMNTFQREERQKELLEEASFANNMQVVGKVGDHAIISNLKLGLDLRGGSQLLLRALKNPPAVPEVTPEVMKAVETVINNRVNSLGVSETVVQRAGTDRLIVEMPGIKDPQQAKDRIGTTALLEFKEMAYDANGVPQHDPVTGAPIWKMDVDLTGKDFEKAQGVPQAGAQNWRITFRFKPEGAKKFGDMTSRLVGKQIGIFLDGQPTERGPDGRPLPQAEYRGITVREAIRGGDGEITGSFTKDQAVDLAMKLNAGSLPTKIEILEERTVGATLGQDSIQKSMVAGIIGIAAVMIFMVAIYGVAGVIANIALVLYTLTTLAIFKTIPVTLTLAGIAGFILSVGMAVDANILIFERTKEELKGGKSLYSAIEAGFGRAFSSIFDSNMNSLIACAVLMIFGTSIVKGFAVTLAIGVVVSMFTAITATRVLLHLIPREVGLFGVKFGAKKPPAGSAPAAEASEGKQTLFR
jgi:preprotein translocase subunit SecD